MTIEEIRSMIARGLRSIQPSLTNPPTLLGREGIIQLAELLKTNSSVTQLHLNAEEIDEVGFRALTLMLELNTTITYLHLGSINTADIKHREEFKKLGTFILRNRMLNKIEELFQKINSTHVHLLTPASTQLSKSDFISQTCKNIDALYNELFNIGNIILEQVKDRATFSEVDLHSIWIKYLACAALFHFRCYANFNETPAAIEHCLEQMPIDSVEYKRICFYINKNDANKPPRQQKTININEIQKDLNRTSVKTALLGLYTFLDEQVECLMEEYHSLYPRPYSSSLKKCPHEACMMQSKLRLFGEIKDNAPSIESILTAIEVFKQVIFKGNIDEQTESQIKLLQRSQLNDVINNFLKTVFPASIRFRNLKITSIEDVLMIAKAIPTTPRLW